MTPIERAQKILTDESAEIRYVIAEALSDIAFQSANLALFPHSPNSAKQFKKWQDFIDDLNNNTKENIK
jgi:hypothetical protein